MALVSPVRVACSATFAGNMSVGHLWGGPTRSACLPRSLCAQSADWRSAGRLSRAAAWGLYGSFSSVDGLQVAQGVSEGEFGGTSGLEALLEQLSRAPLHSLASDELLEQRGVRAHFGRRRQADGVDRRLG